ncbi:MAG: LysM peptidoglycan-binding domain-containing protein [Rhizomicrobium sp.]
MVAIVTGMGLGLERSSGWVLGSRGQLGSSSFGRYGENVTVNGATGNLMIDRTDEILIGQGPDSAVSRAYNSLGALNDDNGDNWRLNAQRQVTNLTGTVNTAGSTVTRTDWDGSDEIYTYNATLGAYVCYQGSGAYDTLSFAANVWTWTDGSSRHVDTYDASNGGRITATRDVDGNQLTYAYTGSLLTRVTTQDGEHTDLTWSGNNLTQIATTLSGGATLTRTRYTYDASNRLSTVTTDLSPEDNAIADGKTVVTTYTYDGTSKRVASISQTGGAHLAITYDASFRVATLAQTQASGVTSTTTIGYDTVNKITTVTDNLGNATKLYYDAANQLTRIMLPPAQSGATAQNIYYAYDANGNVTSATDGGGDVVTYQYDTNGNMTLQRDAAGNTISYFYDTTNTNTALLNRLLTATAYFVPDPDGAGAGQPSQPSTTRYAYDAEGHLRYVVSAQGEVTEYRYNAAGQQSSAIAYRDNTYNVTGLGTTTSIAESALTSWVAAIADKSTSERADTAYDFRGNVSSVKTYSAAAADGTGLTTQRYTVTSYTYDQFGNLLNTATSGVSNAQVFVYDGLGRVVGSTDLNGATTAIAFTDSLNKTVVTLANGLVDTSTYNLAGQLVSSVQSGTGVATGTTAYAYDTLGNLRMVSDATGNKTYYLYDAVGRKVADIAADGSITEYRYDQSDRLVASIGYATRLTSANLSSLVDGSGNPANIALSTIRPAPNAGDVWGWRIYDHADRLIESIDQDGDATVIAYDGMGNVVSTTSYANVIAAATVTGFKTTAPTTLQLPTANAAKDQVTRNFCDTDGRLIGSLNADGYLSQITYNTAGETIDTISYATAAASGLRATGTFAQLQTSVGTVAADIHNRYFYDDEGVLRYTLDDNLRPTEYVYNATGKLIHTTQYGASIGSTSSYTLSYVAGQITTLNLAANADTRTSWSVYNATTGNLAYSVDALGGVTGFNYDAVGHLVKQVQYATLQPLGADASQATMDSWAAGQASNTANRISRMVYDVKGEVVYTVDAEGYVTQILYDTAGRQTGTIRLAASYTVTDAVTQASLATQIGTIPATAVQTSVAYDVDGRIVDSYDGMGVRTHIVYDALGRVTDTTVAYGTGDAATAHVVYDAAGRVANTTVGYGAAESATIAYTYDGLGHVLTVLDGRGYTTTYTYDALGQVLTKTVPIDASNSAVTTYQYDAFGNVAKSIDALGNSSYFYYDGLNRQTLAVDANGYATATIYTVGNAVVSATHYATAVTGTIVVGTPPTVTTSATEDATTTFTRDKLDRVTKVTDAEGYYEQYTLDAFGDRLTVRNKLGGVTTNTFDRRGLLKTEVLPISSTRADGSVEASSVTNAYTYDARGNLLTRIEASGLTEQRTTTYTYDKMNRVLTQVLGNTTTEIISVVSPTDLKTLTNVTPTTTYKYDSRGNLIEQDDANGARALTYYDHLNRRIAAVNALGVLSNWTYDANGNVVAQRVYATAIAIPTTPGGTPPSPAGGDTWRETDYTYDRANELLTTSVASLRTGSWNGSAYSTQAVGAGATVSIANVYDKNGNVVCQTDGIVNGSGGNTSWFYYDKMNRKVAQLDQEGYLTTYALDADGNVTTERRYATRFTGTPTAAAIPSVAIDATNDRVTTFTYDRNGRRLTETRTGVVAWTVNGTNGALTAAATSSTVTYTYNGLGEVTRKTEATGDYTAYTYDSEGRQTSVAGTAFTDYAGANVQQLTNEYYDGLNDLTRTVENSAHVTTYAYGAGGRLATMTDASGFARSYFYDADGRTLKVSYARARSDGTSVTEASATRYDALGRVTFQSVATYNGTSWSFGDQYQMGYNAYGEVVSRGINGVTQETASYDGGGRMIRSTAGDGTVKLYLYNADGKQTLEIASDGNALPAGYAWSSLTVDQAVGLLTNNGASAIGTVAVAGMVVTITGYDKRGLATQSVAPLRQLSTTTTAAVATANAYNAFGEIARQTDARGYVTDFTYNTMGKVILQQSPSVSWTSENGTIATGRPTVTNYYDLSGRVVGVRDANNNLNTRTLLADSGYGGADASVLKEFHADSGVVANGYDVFGDLRQNTNEVGKVETYAYDAMDRLITQVHQARPAGSPGNPTGATVQLTDSYAYDGLGQRIKHWNSQLGATVLDTTDYDAAGRVVKAVDMGGNTTTYAYAWSSAIATAGLGTFGGWTRTTVNAAGLTATEQDDSFGHVVTKTDFGGSPDTLTYTYNSAGWVVSEGLAEYAPAFTYYNTGALATAVSAADHSFVWVNGISGDPGYYVYFTDWTAEAYATDAAGNRVRETVTTYHNIQNDSGEAGPPKYQPGLHATTQEDATVTWDADTRMASYSDTGAANGLLPASVAWEYDLGGDIRRMVSSYRTLDAQGAASATSVTQDYWYKYDAMNRFTLTQGAFSGTRGSGAIVAGTTGKTVAYNSDGSRASAVNAADGTSEAYAYTADGYLAQVTVGGVVRASYALDAMGRVTDQKEYNAAGTSVVYERTAVYNTRSQVTSDQVTSVRSDGTWVTSTAYSYIADSDFDGVYGDHSDRYLGQVTDEIATVTKNGVAQPTTEAAFYYVWRDGALEASESYTPNRAAGGPQPNYNSYTYGQGGLLESVVVGDGRPRTVSFVTNLAGEVLARNEADNNTAAGDPHERHYYFGGIEVGAISNNGTSRVDYAQSIAQHIAVPGTGAFRGGATAATSYADFDQSYDPINGLNVAATAGRYTAQDGDTLEGIAYQVWGDASYWYLLADANGLISDAGLQAGMSLIVPDKVANSHNNSSTYRVYDPNEAQGNNSPTVPKPAARHGGACGVFGQILLAVIAIAVAVVTAGAAVAALGPAGMTLGGGIGTVLSGSAASVVGVGGAIGIGVAAGAAGSIVSQGVGLALGIQNKFSWTGVAEAAIGGGIGAGVAAELGPALGGVDPVVAAAVEGVTSNVLSQGIGVATGLQKSFDWAGVAAAGVGAGVGTYVGGQIAGWQPFGAANGLLNQGARGLVSGMAGDIANAATRTLIDGSDFGDNVIAALPDTIGQTVGNAIAGVIQGSVTQTSQTPQPGSADYHARMDAYNQAIDSGMSSDLLGQIYQFLGLDGGQNMLDLGSQLYGDGQKNTYIPQDKAQQDTYNAVLSQWGSGKIGEASRFASIVAIKEWFQANTETISDSAMHAFNMGLLSADVSFNQSIPELLSGTGFSRVMASQQGQLFQGGTSPVLVDDGSGLYSAIYVSGTIGSSDASYVFAYRGTDFSSAADLFTNAQNNFDIPTKQYEYAVAAAQDLLPSIAARTAFTGQSLGGGLAEAGALAVGRPAVVFNAPGPSGIDLAVYGVPMKNILLKQNLITNYDVVGEWLGDAQAAGIIKSSFGATRPLPDVNPPTINGSKVSTNGLNFNPNSHGVEYDIYGIQYLVQHHIWPY